MKKFSHLLAGILIVAIIAIVITFTGPSLIQNTRIGLEFKGGYEILYKVEPLNSTPLDKSLLLQEAQALESQANTLGISEPEVRIEGTDQIRVLLAGVTNGDEIRSVLNKPNNIPVKITEQYSQTVGGVLGASDLHDTVFAGLVALGITFVLLILLYRLKGFIAIFTLIVYLWLLLLAFNLLHATLSLAAIVAFVLGVGVAAGSNIIFFERIKEELRTNSSPALALKESFASSLRTIFDSNVTIIIGAIVLFAMGIGPIRGFALTMTLSILVSFISNVFLARLLMNLFFLHKYTSENNIETEERRIIKSPDLPMGLNILKNRNIFLLATSLILIIGIGSIAFSSFNYDIDFKAGTALDVTLPTSIDQENATSVMEDAGIPPATVAVGGKDSNQIAARFDDVLTHEQVTTVVDAFKNEYGESVAYVENTSDPSVAQQLAFKAIIAILLAVGAMFIFITLRFNWRIATAATIGIISVGLFVLSVFSLFKLEIDVTFIAAMLTIIGYAANEVVVVFDRVRENSNLTNGENPTSIMNLSIKQVFTRSIYTVSIVVIGATCLYFLGAEPLQMFSLAIFVGLLTGTFVSICVAPAIWSYLIPSRTHQKHL
jgi:preprotein translocase SecF subunit